MGTELKPCPFCGGEAILGNTRDNAHFWVECEDSEFCGVETLSSGTAETAAKTWNTRSPSRNDVLEEAARVAEEKGLNAFRHGHGKKWRDFGEGCTSTADAIRALKDRDR